LFLIEQELPMATMFVDGLGQNDQSLQRTFHRCFLPSFGSFRQAVSVEKIFKNQQYLSLEGPLYRLLISFRFISKHRQFLFLIGQFLKIFSSETTLPNEPQWRRFLKISNICIEITAF
jgi:hypothetical protein